MIEHPWLIRAEQALNANCTSEARMHVRGYMFHYPDDEDANRLLARLDEQGGEPLPPLRRRVALPEQIWQASAPLTKSPLLFDPSSTHSQRPSTSPDSDRSKTSADSLAVPRPISRLSFSFIPLFLVIAVAMLPTLLGNRMLAALQESVGVSLLIVVAALFFFYLFLWNGLSQVSLSVQLLDRKERP